jgi:hypothetical protein
VPLRSSGIPKRNNSGKVRRRSKKAVRETKTPDRYSNFFCHKKRFVFIVKEYISKGRGYPWNTLFWNKKNSVFMEEVLR